MGGGEYRYEWISEERHHHLVCRRCGGTTLLNNVRMETLGAEIFDEHGFEADIDHFAIFGVCRECLEDSQAG
jgi:Fur family ferric uptake transcriptional regulator